MTFADILCCNQKIDFEIAIDFVLTIFSAIAIDFTIAIENVFPTFA